MWVLSGSQGKRFDSGWAFGRAGESLTPPSVWASRPHLSGSEGTVRLLLVRIRGRAASCLREGGDLSALVAGRGRAGRATTRGRQRGGPVRLRSFPCVSWSGPRCDIVPHAVSNGHGPPYAYPPAKPVASSGPSLLGHRGRGGRGKPFRAARPPRPARREQHLHLVVTAASAVVFFHGQRQGGAVVRREKNGSRPEGEGTPSQSGAFPAPGRAWVLGRREAIQGEVFRGGDGSGRGAQKSGRLES